MSMLPPPTPLQPIATEFPPTTPITNFSVLEDQKENIRPLSTGRSAATLSTIFAAEKAEAERVVHEGHERCRKMIEEAERRENDGEEMEEGIVDVLDPYCKYLAFITQHHPSSLNHLLPFLEHTTRHFLTDTRFSQDLRFLKLWVQYAKLVEKERAEEIWVFLNSREVGTGWGLFYEEWAAACEARGRVTKADEALRLGIARKAQPLKRLQTHYEAFQARTTDLSYVAPSLLSQIEAQSYRANQPPATSLSSNGRAVLGVRSTATPRSQPQPRSNSGSVKNNGAKLDIFSDESGGGEIAESNEEWTEFGTRSANRKENTLEAVGWKGEVLHQKGLAVGMMKSEKMEVFSDETASKASRPALSADEVFSRRLPTTEAELLRVDPLRHYNLTSNKPTSPSGLPTVTIPTPSRPKSAPKPATVTIGAGASWTVPDEGRDVPGKNGKVERRMFEWEEVFKHGDEWSFEEVRARKAGLLKIAMSEVGSWEKAWHEPGATSPKLEKTKRTMSPTINTKAAMKDVYELFNQTLVNGGLGGGADSSSESSSEDEDEDSDDGMKSPAHEVQPTPLPLPRSMLAPGQGHGVPPTPTPNQGYLSGRRAASDLPLQTVLSDEEEVESPPTAPLKTSVFATPSAPARTSAIQVFSDENAPAPTPSQPVFADENAVPASANRLVKSSVFGQTPAKTPLATKTISATPAKTPLGIFRDPSTEEQTSASSSSTLPSQAFSTPIPASREPRRPVRRGVFGVEPPAQILEEDEEQEGSSGRVEPQQLEREPYQRAADDDDEDEADMRVYARQRGMRCGGAFDMMTPITERTCEFTMNTQAMTMRSSLSGGMNTRTSSTQLGDEGFLGSSMDDTDTGPQTFNPAVMTLEPTALDMTGRDRSTESPFFVSEGHSIESREGLNPTINTLVIVEKGGKSREASPAVEVEPQVAQEVVAVSEAPVSATVSISGTKRLSSVSSTLSTFAPPNPCNPLDDDVLGAIVRAANLEELPAFMDLRDTQGHNLESLQKTAKSRMRRNSSSSLNKSQSSDQGDWEVEVGGKQFQIKEKIGEGGFGAVFKGIDVAAYEAELDASDDEDEEEAALDGSSKSTIALKVENPPNLWEAIVLARIRMRLTTALHSSVVRSRGLYCYQDESFMIMDYHSQGTLLDAVNKAQSMGLASAASGAPGGIDELVAVFFAIELMRLVEGLHRADFIHGDLKIDNCLVRLDECRGWSNQYDRTGQNGWSAKGIRLIDFGRAIDLQCFPEGRRQTFIADWAVDDRDCQEIRTGRPWSFEADYHGIASICYCMLFGKYISTEVAPSLPEDGMQKRYRIAGEKLRRYWQGDMWSKLFDLCLNSRLSAQEMPPSDKLAEIRVEFEDWLEENCSKGGKNLKSLLSALYRNTTINAK